MVAKVSISMPDPLYRRFERVRRARGLDRSAAVQRAIERWTALSDDQAHWDWEFIEAYRRVPQDSGSEEAWLEATAETWEKPPRTGRVRREP